MKYAIVSLDTRLCRPLAYEVLDTDHVRTRTKPLIMRSPNGKTRATWCLPARLGKRESARRLIAAVREHIMAQAAAATKEARLLKDAERTHDHGRRVW